MTLISKNGFLAVITLDRLDDLRRMVKSLRKHNTAPLQVMVARDWTDAQRLKCGMGLFTAFESTVFLDTDMYINGDLSALFAIADEGKLAIHKEGDKGPWNSGVMAFNRELGARLCSEWLPLFKANIIGRPDPNSSRAYTCCDQHFLNKIIDKYPIHPLSGVYNYITYNHSLEDEAKDWDAVKIFHFIHRACKHRTESRAYKAWMGL